MSEEPPDYERVRRNIKMMDIAQWWCVWALLVDLILMMFSAIRNAPIIHWSIMGGASLALAVVYTFAVVEEQRQRRKLGPLR